MNQKIYYRKIQESEAEGQTVQWKYYRLHHTVNFVPKHLWQIKITSM